MAYIVMNENCLDALKSIQDNSIDSIVTDPPYGLSSNDYVAETIAKWIQGERDFIPDGKGFMGKSWDAFVPPPAVWDECFRVLKPGGHLLAFFGSRTQDVGALSIRLAGFEIRDSIAWLYSSGFPKSHNISKAIDKHLGAEREVIGVNPNVVRESKIAGGSDYGGFTKANAEITASATPEAEKWEGWGTALKPAFEPIIMARKPLIGTVAENVLQYETGGINIDGNRIGDEEVTINAFDNGAKPFGGAIGEPYTQKTVVGRWPANVIFDEKTAELLDKQAYASKFFYVSKVSKKERNEGLDQLPDHNRQNSHPTVKPITLMTHLVSLVTPPNGLVLDPFAGSGSTGVACIQQGFNFIGIELTPEYIPIIEARLAYADSLIQEEGGLFD